MKRLSLLLILVALELGGVTWGRAADAAHATDEASTTDTLGAGGAGVEFRARPDRSGREQVERPCGLIVK
jgi:hypothetical protein